MPASHLRWRTANESRGVERYSSNSWTWKPAAARTRAQSSRELGRVVPGVAGDHARPRRIGPFFPRDVIGQAPRALGHGPIVQDIGTDRVHLTAAPTGAELEHGVKGIVKHLPAPRVDVLDQLRAIGQKRRLGQPASNIGNGRGGQITRRLGARPVPGLRRRWTRTWRRSLRHSMKKKSWEADTIAQSGREADRTGVSSQQRPRPSGDPASSVRAGQAACPGYPEASPFASRQAS